MRLFCPENLLLTLQIYTVLETLESSQIQGYLHTGTRYLIPVLWIRIWIDPH
jgi:hypothetical protein